MTAKLQGACRWAYDSDDMEGDSYFTGCDERNVAWEVGTPTEHGYRFCPYCGKPLKLAGRERPRPLREAGFPSTKEPR